MKDWSDDPIDFRKWKRVPGNPFADYDHRDAIALWSLWEMPSSAVGKLVRRGRPRGVPTTVRSVRLPTTEWERLEREARRRNISLNALIASRLRRAPRVSTKAVTPPEAPRRHPAS